MRLSLSKTRLFVLAFLLAFLSSSAPILAVQKSAFMRVYDLKAGHSKWALAGNNPVSLIDPEGLAPNSNQIFDPGPNPFRGIGKNPLNKARVCRTLYRVAKAHCYRLLEPQDAECAISAIEFADCMTNRETLMKDCLDYVWHHPSIITTIPMIPVPRSPKDVF